MIAYRSPGGDIDQREPCKAYIKNPAQPQTRGMGSKHPSLSRSFALACRMDKREMLLQNLDMAKRHVEGGHHLIARHEERIFFSKQVGDKISAESLKILKSLLRAQHIYETHLRLVEAELNEFDRRASE